MRPSRTVTQWPSDPRAASTSPTPDASSSTPAGAQNGAPGARASGHGLERVAEERPLHEAAERAEEEVQLRLLRRLDGAARAARLQRERVRPLPGEEPH